MGAYLIIGAGFAGCVCARELADAGHEVRILDKRSHIGGNAFDELDAHGVLVHRYGPHLFHTNSEIVFRYLSRFTEWHPYEHRALAMIDGRPYPFPINRITLNQLYGLDLDDEGAAEFFERVREPRDKITNSEDLVLNAVGRDLYEKFYLNYTKKQWGIHPSRLKSSVTARIPVRTNDDDRYFTDRFQAIPLNGYTHLFERMLDHPAISLELDADFLLDRSASCFDHIVYTGPIDAYFDYRWGRLPYRSLHFEHEHLPDTGQYQTVGQVNYPNDGAFTRITEFKHITGQAHAGTSIVREYPRADGEPYYPVPQVENEVLFNRYKCLALREEGVSFVGRLAQYRYYNMDQVVAAAHSAVGKIIGSNRTVRV